MHIAGLGAEVAIAFFSPEFNRFEPLDNTSITVQYLRGINNKASVFQLNFLYQLNNLLVHK
jgi:hypothetical protein